jgi:acetylornithine deacetylase/succinyl-diaminopimelate desuccinylase-like protein
VIALDSWCWTSDRLWLTTSLRGIVSVDVTVEVLTEGVHSGGAGGVVPSSFKALRQLVSRVEDDETGRILLPELHVPIPDERRAQIDAVASELDIADSYPWAPGVRPLGTGPADQITARTWRPCMEVLAMGGAPPIGHGGNVLRPYTSATLGFRVPPRCDARAAGEAVVRVLTTDPPHGAHVRARVTAAEGGWDAPPTAPWLEAALSAASTAAFGQEHRAIGEGGTIPFMGMLGAQLPDAQFCITGVLGPGSNAHGPNEFLHIPTATRVTAATAHLLDAHARR